MERRLPKYSLEDRRLWMVEDEDPGTYEQISKAYKEVAQTPEGKLMFLDLANKLGFLSTHNRDEIDLIYGDVMKYIFQRLGAWTPENAWRIISFLCDLSSVETPQEEGADVW